MFQSALLRKERPSGSSWSRGASEFQSALLRKERQVWADVTRMRTLFQSALLRKERRHDARKANGGRGFNPRSYARSDIAYKA